MYQWTTNNIRSGLRRHCPLLPSLRTGLYTCAALVYLAGQLPARTRGQTFWPSAVVGKQRLSLRSSQQWARTAQLSPARGWVTDRAQTTTARASRDDIGPQNDADGWKRWSGRSERRDGSRQSGSSEYLSTPTRSRWRSHQDNALSAMPPTAPRNHSAPLRYRCAAPAAPLLVTALLSFCSSPLMSLLLTVTLP